MKTKFNSFSSHQLIPFRPRWRYIKLTHHLSAKSGVWLIVHKLLETGTRFGASALNGTTNKVKCEMHVQTSSFELQASLLLDDLPLFMSHFAQSLDISVVQFPPLSMMLNASCFKRRSDKHVEPLMSVSPSLASSLPWLSFYDFGYQS
jgi:hypothetical protein